MTMDATADCARPGVGARRPGQWADCDVVVGGGHNGLVAGRRRLLVVVLPLPSHGPEFRLAWIYRRMRTREQGPTKSLPSTRPCRATARNLAASVVSRSQAVVLTPMGVTPMR